jgi:hypothetical protein
MITAAVGELMAHGSLSCAEALVLDILRGTPSERFADRLFPFLNLVDDERMICVLAAPTETDLVRCPLVVIDAAGESLHLLASSFAELVGLFPWSHGLLVEIAVHVTRSDQRAKKGAMKSPQQKFGARVAKMRKQLDAALPRRLNVDAELVEDPIAAIMRARDQHRARLQ